MDQAADRIHRIGQKFSVNIYYLLASGTIEEQIAQLLDKKRKVVDAVMDGKEPDQESLLSELIKSYTQII
jgi:SNF2 family DNA or RNA helicase